MDWEDMYENGQNDGGRSEGEDPANRSEIGGPVTSQSDRGEGELQDEEKDDEVEDPNTPGGNGEESETEDEGETRYWNLKQTGDEVAVHKVGTYQSYHT